MNEYDNWFSREGEERYIRLRKEVQRRLGRERQETDSMVRRQIYEVLAQEASQAYLPVRERVLIGSRIFYALRGLDILQPLLEDEAITEIMVNGPDHIYVE